MTHPRLASSVSSLRQRFRFAIQDIVFKATGCQRGPVNQHIVRSNPGVWSGIVVASAIARIVDTYYWSIVHFTRQFIDEELMSNLMSGCPASTISLG